MKPALGFFIGRLDKKVSNSVEALSRVHLVLDFILSNNILFAFAGAHDSAVSFAVIFLLAHPEAEFFEHILGRVETSHLAIEHLRPRRSRV